MQVNQSRPSPLLRGDFTIEHADGWKVEVDTCTEGGGPGWPREVVMERFGQPVLTDREAWDMAHPGVEPTPEALMKAAQDAEDWLADEAYDQHQLAISEYDPS